MFLPEGRMEASEGIEPRLLLSASGRRPTGDQEPNGGSLRLREKMEASEGIEPPYKDLQSSASPLRHEAPCGEASLLAGVGPHRNTQSAPS